VGLSGEGTSEKTPRRSTLHVLGLPDSFGGLLLTLGLVLLLGPYFAGSDFGVLKVPSFPPDTIRILKVVGPAAIVLVVLCFLPLWKPREVPKRPARPAKLVRKVPGGVRMQLRATDPVPQVVGLAVSRYQGWHWRRQPFYDDLATVIAELILNAFTHGDASFVDVGLYEYAVVLQDNGAEFNPLVLQPRAKVTGGAGLFALKHFLQHAHPTVEPDYRYVDESFNELVLYILKEHRSGESQPVVFNISFRGATDWHAVSDTSVAHKLNLCWGFRHYKIDYRKIRKQRYLAGIRTRLQDLIHRRRADIVSQEFRVLESIILPRLPPGAVVHLEAGADGMLSDYSREIAERYPGRIVVD